MCKKKDLSYLIDKIVQSDLFKQANYYFRTLKKQHYTKIPDLFYPNLNLKHYIIDTFNLFIQDSENTPYFLSNLIKEVYDEYLKCEIDVEQLYNLCFNDDNFQYSDFSFLKPNENSSSSSITSNLGYNDYFKLDHKLIYALICYLIKCKIVTIDSLDEIIKYELLKTPHNDDGLSLINNANFLAKGFTIDEKYYLYNIFFNTTVELENDSLPYTIKIINNEINNKQIFFRCDEKLAVPIDKMILTPSENVEKYREINVNIKNIENLIDKKEILIYQDNSSLNKIFIKTSLNTDLNGKNFYKINIEGMWNPIKIKDSFIITNCAYAYYYPDEKIFKKVGFYVSQYPKDIFKEKYDNYNINSNIYDNQKYKIWYVKSDIIKINTGIRLIYSAFDKPFRDLFIDFLSK